MARPCIRSTSRERVLGVNITLSRSAALCQTGTSRGATAQSIACLAMMNASRTHCRRTRFSRLKGRMPVREGCNACYRKGYAIPLASVLLTGRSYRLANACLWLSMLVASSWANCSGYGVSESWQALFSDVSCTVRRWSCAYGTFSVYAMRDTSALINTAAPVTSGVAKKPSGG